MTSSIFFLRDGKLETMREAAYLTEDDLQLLVADNPELLPGDQVNAIAPRRWLLVTREATVPDDDGTGRWSLDHLFLDQDGIPTLVEVKRSTDTRIRREVVGQMLDYAANAVAHWPMDRIRGFLEKRCEREEKDCESILSDFLNEEDGVDSEPIQDVFWTNVKTNISAGRIRMIFVADSIPPELRRIVEFLNEQMDPAEVLAVEIKKYSSKDLTSLVPKVVGQTAQAERRKSVGTVRGKAWTEERFFQDMSQRDLPRAVITTARRLLEWARAKNLEIDSGHGTVDGSLIARFRSNGEVHQLFTLWSYGRVELRLIRFARTRAMEKEAVRLELLDMLNRIPGVSLPRESIDKRPALVLESIASDENYQQLLDCLSWILTTFAESPNTA